MVSCSVLPYRTFPSSTKGIGSYWVYVIIQVWTTLVSTSRSPAMI